MIGGAPQRTKNHRTDTMAVRKVAIGLGPDLLVRSMEDRDYGIDAMVERYQGEAVSQILFFQIKGTASEISPLLTAPYVSLNDFPLRTAIYAEQFVQPFIVAYTSVAGGRENSPVYYLWLQRYIRNYLDINSPAWRAGPADGDITLRFPVANVLDGRNDRLKNIAASAVIDFQTLKLIKAYAQLQVMLANPVLPSDLDEIWRIVRILERCDEAATNYDRLSGNAAGDFRQYRLNPLLAMLPPVGSSFAVFSGSALQVKLNTVYKWLEGLTALSLADGVFKFDW